MGAGATKPTILLLGCGHWDNPGLDMLNVQYDNFLAPQRQREIRDCVERFKSFGPTKVALEVLAERTDGLNAEYREYLDGSFALTANEVHQLGFRIAADLGHDQVYAIDQQEMIGFDHALSFAKDHDQSAALDEWIAQARERNDDLNGRVRTMSVLDLLREANDPANLQFNQRIYMLLAKIGTAGHYVGAEVVARWHERNLKIFANLTRITTSPDDRILVIIGAGHIPLLTHLVESSGLYTLELVEPYLSQ